MKTSLKVGDACPNPIDIHYYGTSMPCRMATVISIRPNSIDLMLDDGVGCTLIGKPFKAFVKNYEPEKQCPSSEPQQ